MSTDARSNRIVAVLRALGVIACLAIVPRDAVSQADPATLEQAVEAVQAMRARGASNAELAAYVTGIADRRMVNANSWEGVVHREWPPLGYYYDSRAWRTHRQYQDEREGAVATGALRGREYESRARWAWNMRYGQCGEASSITYFLLHEAGVPARMMEVPGHAFTVIGLAPGADSNDRSTWGSGAVIADAWLGRTLTPADSNRHWAFRGRPTDVTGGYDNPDLYARDVANQGRSNLQLAVSCEGQPVVGVLVEASGPETRTTFTGANGRADFVALLDGTYTLTATPAVASGYERGTGSADVRRQRVGFPTEASMTIARTVVQPVDVVVRTVDADGAPVAGATVTSGVGATTTDAEGIGALRAMPGELTVTATKSGVGAGATTIRIEPFFASYANVVLRPAEVRLAFTAPASGASIDASRVTLTGTAQGGEVTQVILELDGQRIPVGVVDGVFVHDAEIAPGMHIATATAPGASPVTVAFTRSEGAAPPPVEGLVDPWVGRYRMHGRTVCSMDGVTPSPVEMQFELTSRRSGERAVRLAFMVQGQAAEHELTLTPSNPNAASESRSQEAPAVVPGGSATTTVRVAAFVRAGRIYYSERQETHSTATVLGRTATSSMVCDSMFMGEPVR